MKWIRSSIWILAAGDDETQPTVKSTSGAARFAQDALADWISQLRDMPEHDELMHFIGLPKKIIEKLGDELITGVDRLKLEQKLIRSLNDAEARAAVTRHKLVERQVLVVRSLLNDFVDYLGNSDRPLEGRAASPAEKGRVLFEPPPALAEKVLPELPLRPDQLPAHVYPGLVRSLQAAGDRQRRPYGRARNHAPAEHATG